VRSTSLAMLAFFFNFTVKTSDAELSPSRSKKPWFPLILLFKFVGQVLSHLHLVQYQYHNILRLKIIRFAITYATNVHAQHINKI
jgi:hypothetical protein